MRPFLRICPEVAMMPTMVPRLSNTSKKSIVSTQTQRSGESTSSQENWQTSGAGDSGSENSDWGMAVTPIGMPARVTMTMLSSSPPCRRTMVNSPVSMRPSRKSSDAGLVSVSM